MIETVKVSEKAKMQLINIKKKTGISNWNVICRWAFLISIAQNHRPPEEDISADSSVEMTWKTFAGSGKEEIYTALLLRKAKKDGVRFEGEEISKYFKLHLHRGISYINTNASKSIRDFLAVALSKKTS